MENPKYLPDCELSQRLRLAFRQRYEKRKRWQNISGWLSLFSGSLLLLPALLRLVSQPEILSLRWSGVLNSLNWLLNGQAQWQTIQSLAALAAEVVATIAITTWIGLVMLAIGSSISLTAWLPTSMREA